MALTLGRADAHDGAITRLWTTEPGCGQLRRVGQDAAAAGVLEELLDVELLEELSLLLLLDEAAEPLDSDLISLFVSLLVSATVAPERLSVR
jgi:hypothetical protein